MKLSKEQVAARQLDTAIELFFNGGDPVSVQCLADNASRVLWKLVTALGRESKRDQLVEAHNGGKQKAIDALGLASNFSKHADRDPFGSLVFNEEVNDGMIIMAVEDYLTCVNQHKSGASPLSIPMSIFRLWFYTQNPTLIAPPNSKEDDFLQHAAEIFPNVNSLPRFERLSQGAEVLRQQMALNR